MRRALRWLARRELERDPILALDFIRSRYKFGCPPGLSITFEENGTYTVRGTATEPGTYLVGLNDRLQVIDVKADR